MAVFTDGLLDNSMARKVMKEGSDTFEEAVQIAMWNENWDGDLS